MFPIKAEQLALTEIADYWAREIKPRATQAELLTILEKAWFRGEMIGAGRPTRLDLLRAMYNSTQGDLVFVIGDEPGPPEIQDLEDGGALVDVHVRVRVPSSSPKNWTEEECSEAFATIADQWSTDWNIEQVEVWLPLAEVTYAEFHKWLGTTGYTGDQPVAFWAPTQSSKDTDKDLPTASIDNVRKWYVEDYIPKMLAEGQRPGFPEDLEAARKQFEGYKITHLGLTQIRAKEAPPDWKLSNKKKFRTRKTKI